MSIHPADLLTQITCLVQVEALLDNVQLHQLLVALLIVLQCKLVERTIITILIIQQNNISTIDTVLPLSGPGGPCKCGTRPELGAASSPVALRCREEVRGLHSSTAVG
jgi:hypothetical protein